MLDFIELEKEIVKVIRERKEIIEKLKEIVEDCRWCDADYWSDEIWELIKIYDKNE